MKGLFWIITIISTVIGGLIAFIGVTAANGAPQEAAAAAVGMALAVIPYVFSRAISELSPQNSNAKPATLPPEATRICPHCAEPIKMQAVVCRWCCHDVTATDQQSPHDPDLSHDELMAKYGVSHDGDKYIFQNARFATIYHAAAFAAKSRETS